MNVINFGREKKRRDLKRLKGEIKRIRKDKKSEERMALQGCCSMSEEPLLDMEFVMEQGCNEETLVELEREYQEKLKVYEQEYKYYEASIQQYKRGLLKTYPFPPIPPLPPTDPREFEEVLKNPKKLHEIENILEEVRILEKARDDH